jgi:hypothetical protein
MKKSKNKNIRFFIVNILPYLYGPQASRLHYGPRTSVRSVIIKLMNKQYRTFDQFWPYYVLEHSRKGTRVLHFFGTSLLFVFLIHALLAQSLFSLLAGVICAYGFAWTGHFLIEKNRPATFQYPLFSLIGDFKMYGLMWTGRMEREIERLRLRTT